MSFIIYAIAVTGIILLIIDTLIRKLTKSSLLSFITLIVIAFPIFVFSWWFIIGLAFYFH